MDLWIRSPTGEEYGIEADIFGWNLFGSRDLKDALIRTLNDAQDDLDRAKERNGSVRWDRSYALALIA